MIPFNSGTPYGFAILDARAHDGHAPKLPYYINLITTANGV